MASYENAFNVKVGYRLVFYFEAEKWLEFPIEKEDGKLPCVELPLPNRWKDEMPLWAKERRDEIITRIRQKAGETKFIWKET